MATENPPTSSGTDPSTTTTGNGESPSSSSGTPAASKGSPSPVKRSKRHKYYKPVGNTPTTAKADRLIIMAMGGTIGIVTLAHFSGEKTVNSVGEAFRTSAGTIIAGTMLLVLAEAEPELAIMIAFLILLGALLVHGKVLGDVLNNITHAKPVATPDLSPGGPVLGGNKNIPNPLVPAKSVPVAPVFPTMNV